MAASIRTCNTEIKSLHVWSMQIINMSKSFMHDGEGSSLRDPIEEARKWTLGFRKNLQKFQ